MKSRYTLILSLIACALTSSAAANVHFMQRPLCQRALSQPQTHVMPGQDRGRAIDQGHVIVGERQEIPLSQMHRAPCYEAQRPCNTIRSPYREVLTHYPYYSETITHASSYREVVVVEESPYIIRTRCPDYARFCFEISL